jgi:hypothetical protein
LLYISSELSEIGESVGLGSDIFLDFLDSLVDSHELGLGCLVKVLAKVVDDMKTALVRFKNRDNNRLTEVGQP